MSVVNSPEHRTIERHIHRHARYRQQRPDHPPFQLKPETVRLSVSLGCTAKRFQQHGYWNGTGIISSIAASDAANPSTSPYGGNAALGIGMMEEVDAPSSVTSYEIGFCKT